MGNVYNPLQVSAINAGFIIVLLNFMSNVQLEHCAGALPERDSDPFSLYTLLTSLN